MSQMPFKLSLGTGPQDVSFWDEAEYSPPKDAMDRFLFNDFLASGTFSLPDVPNLELKQHIVSPVKDFFLLGGTPTAKVKEGAFRSDPVEVDRVSVTESLKTTAQTVTTAPSSTYKTDTSSNLVKRNSTAEGSDQWLNGQVLRERIYRESVSVDHRQKDGLFNVVFGSDLAVDKVAKLAIRIIDRVAPIANQEWGILSNLDRHTLGTYMAQVFGQSKDCSFGLDSPAELNQLLAVKLKGRRNEEKLNKTVKRVNTMIARSFADLNGLADVDDETLAGVLQAAYFGETDETRVFGINTAFSQKSFGKAVENARYAEDFEAVLKSSYIGELLRSRHQKVLKEVKSLRKSLQEGRDPALLLDHSKRSPWLLEDIIDGAKLCQNIIDRSKIS